VSQNTEICRGFLRVAFRSSEKRQCAGYLLTRSGSNFAKNYRGPRSTSRDGAHRRLSTLLFLIYLPTLIQLLRSHSIESYDNL
jgi:hypothetical protein